MAKLKKGQEVSRDFLLPAQLHSFILPTSLPSEGFGGCGLLDTPQAQSESVFITVLSRCVSLSFRDGFRDQRELVQGREGGQ